MKIWWSFSIKFFIPWVLWHVLFLFDIAVIFNLSGDKPSENTSRKLLYYEILKGVYIVPFIALLAYFAYTDRFTEDDFDRHLFEVKDLMKSVKWGTKVAPA